MQINNSTHTVREPTTCVVDELARQAAERPDHEYPVFKRYTVPTELCSLEALPFVDYPNGITGDGASHWRVAPTSDPIEACDLGRAYALHLAQYIKDNPLWVGSAITSKILGEINGDGRPDHHLMGFCAVLEILIARGARGLDIEAAMNGEDITVEEG